MAQGKKPKYKAEIHAFVTITRDGGQQSFFDLTA
jgi:hypothetical protein